MMLNIKKLIFCGLMLNWIYANPSLRTCKVSNTTEKYLCVVGKSGVKINKKEGDGGTPKGIFTLQPTLYYRADHLKKSEIEILKASENHGFITKILEPQDIWVDDPKSEKYNQFALISEIDPKISHEKLYRDDELYDIVLVINYNTHPIISHKGSAIFIHIARKKNQSYGSTDGCVAFSKPDLLKIIAQINTKTQIKIPKNSLKKIVFL